MLENYNECLHCPTIHPELVAVVPAYKKGNIFQSDRADGGVTLADGRTAMVTDPRLRLPLLPGFQGQGDPSAYYGAGIYPSMFLDVDGSTALATAVFPTGPRSCRLVTEYLFSPKALEDPGFDPSPVVEFNERVTRQDNEACERVQLAGLVLPGGQLVNSTTGEGSKSGSSSAFGLKRYSVTSRQLRGPVGKTDVARRWSRRRRGTSWGRPRRRSRPRGRPALEARAAAAAAAAGRSTIAVRPSASVTPPSSRPSSKMMPFLYAGTTATSSGWIVGQCRHSL